MKNMKKLLQKKAMTLVEVLIAVAILALVLAGALGIVQTGVFVSVQSTQMMIADVAAQQLVEELVGRDRAEVTEHMRRADGAVGTPNEILRNGETSDGIRYRIEIVEDFMGFDELFEVTVEILGDGGNPIHTLEAVLNVGG
jgi:prepilin-type N-terminal cleavage/methylation domain-containing protein